MLGGVFTGIVDAAPTDAKTLLNYANFLARQRGDKDGAEAYYKRAIEADPKNAAILANYANFRARQRGDKDGAEAYYKRAIEADPTRGDVLADYGQFLVGLARLSEGEKALLSAFENLDRSIPGNMAEVCFSLWLVAQMHGQNAERWEQYFKFVIQEGFERHPWTFEHMLEQAEKTLPQEKFEYAKALALAFLDESKVIDLERDERWRALEPLDPKAQKQSKIRAILR